MKILKIMKIQVGKGKGSSVVDCVFTLDTLRQMGYVFHLQGNLTHL